MSRKEAELDRMLLLNINRKSYMGSPMTVSHLASVTLKDQCQGNSDFESSYLVKESS